MISIYIGAVGSGKTTLGAKLAHQSIRKGRKVYSNIIEISGVIPITIEDIGKFNLHDALVIIDEAGIEYNNRALFDKKQNKMSPDAIRWWKLSRHFRCDAVIFSQAQDFDVTLRRLAERIYILRKSIIPCFSSYKRLAARWVTDQTTGDPRLEWNFVPLSTRWFYRPRWYKYFNSYNVPDLPSLPADDDDTAWEQFLGKLPPAYTDNQAAVSFSDLSQRGRIEPLEAIRGEIDSQWESEFNDAQ